MVGGRDGEDRGADGDVLEDLIGVAHGVENGSVVVEVQHVEVDGDGGGEGGSPRVLRLHHQDVVLHLLGEERGAEWWGGRGVLGLEGRSGGRRVTYKSTFFRDLYETFGHILGYLYIPTDSLTLQYLEA